MQMLERKGPPRVIGNHRVLWANPGSMAAGSKADVVERSGRPKSSLAHAEQLTGTARREAREDAENAPGAIDDAVAVLREGEGPGRSSPGPSAGFPLCPAGRGNSEKMACDRVAPRARSKKSLHSPIPDATMASLWVHAGACRRLLRIRGCSHKTLHRTLGRSFDP